ncbi:hypothetical protein FPV63_10235 [Vibrio cholerae]|nr:hypothetical protein D5E78_04480 [Vibrio parahaemolyticus]TVN04570.1 hypothetical protein FPV63_10235 [Vibrio cholerae]
MVIISNSLSYFNNYIIHKQELELKQVLKLRIINIKIKIEKTTMKMEVERYGFFVCAQNDDITLAGGLRSGNSRAHETRLKYIIMDNHRIKSLMKEGIDQVEAQRLSEVGHVELFVEDGTLFDVNGLVNIVIKNEKNFKERRQGYATKVIQSIVATTGKDLEIMDIQPGNAARFWKSLGTVFHNGHGKEITNAITKKSGIVHGTVSKEKVLSISKEKNKESSFDI